MAKELFTHRGSGTLVRRGERVLCVDSWQALDLEKLKSLVESGFGRRLAPGELCRRGAGKQFTLAAANRVDENPFGLELTIHQVEASGWMAFFNGRGPRESFKPPPSWDLKIEAPLWTALQAGTPCVPQRAPPSSTGSSPEDRPGRLQRPAEHSCEG